MDGVLADFSAAYQDVEARLFGPVASTAAGEPDAEAGESTAAEMHEFRGIGRRHDAVWDVIRDTPDFWLTLKPTDERAVRRIHEMMLRHPWEGRTACARGAEYRASLPARFEQEAKNLSAITGWKISEIAAHMALTGQSIWRR